MMSWQQQKFRDIFRHFIIVIEGKITRPNFFCRINFSILRKLFALPILRVEFEHFYSG
jgi:hypothetical protein